eukprot:scaffold75505_cov34-Prasinocladus_malaysianus.AAC.1
MQQANIAAPLYDLAAGMQVDPEDEPEKFFWFTSGDFTDKRFVLVDHWTPCGNPVRYHQVSGGSYTFRMFARDLAGNEAKQEVMKELQ